MTTDVTVCVPCFNNSATIEETLKSIQNQEYSNFKILVIDNCSTDDTLAVVTKIAKQDPRISVIKNSVNLGLEGNLTRCIELSDSEFTSIWHSDDIYFPSMLKAQIHQFNIHPQLSAIFAHGFEINAIGKRSGQRFLPTEWTGRELITLTFHELLHFTLKYGNVISCPTLTARSRVLKNELKRFDYAKFKSAADLDAWFRLAAIAPIGILTEPLFLYRKSEASFTVREVKGRTTQHDLFIVLDDQLSKVPSIQDSAEYRWYYEFLRMKDLAVRCWNWRRSHSGEDPYLNNSRNWRVLMQALLKTNFHRKFGLAAILIFVVRKLRI